VNSVSIVTLLRKPHSLDTFQVLYQINGNKLTLYMIENNQFVHRRDNHTKGDNPAGVVVPGGDDIEPAAVV